MKKKPNVILMLIDDLGYGDISAFNENSKINTKHIDKLCANGMKFTDAHSTSPLCSPARYGLMTGRYNFRSRMKCSVLTGDSFTLIEHNRKTLPKLFQDQGYRTACIGKWHLGLDWQLKENPHPADFGVDEGQYDYRLRVGREEFFPWIELLSNKVAGLDVDYQKPIRFGPNQYGFEYFFGMPASLDQPPYLYIENDRVVTPPTTTSGVQPFNRFSPTDNEKWEYGPSVASFDPAAVSDMMQEKVLHLLDEYSEEKQPFFLYYPTMAVHSPFLPNARFKGKSGLNSYADFVLQTDDYVGQITEKLKEKGLFEDTIFIFTSDNGCSPAADYPYLTERGHNPSYHFRGHKSSMYEGGHRVPTAIQYPNRIRAGSVCQDTICQSDFLRTFATLFDVTLDDETGEDSFDLTPLWFETGKSGRTATVCNSSYGYLGLIKGSYKLLCCEQDGMNIDLIKHFMLEPNYKPDFQLYDLSKDIGEQENLFHVYPNIAQPMMTELKRIIEKGRQTQGVPQKNFTPKYWPQADFS